MTQRKVAEVVNVTESVISKYESGASDPSIATMKRLAKYYGVVPNYAADEDILEKLDDAFPLIIGAEDLYYTKKLN